MSDSDSPPGRRHSRDHHESDRRRNHSRDRKRPRSRSPSLDRDERQTKRHRSPREDRHGRPDHDRRNEREDRHRRRHSREHDEYKKHQRSRSPDQPRRQRRRSQSRDSVDRLRRKEDDRQLTHSNRRRESSRDRHRHRRHSTSRSPPRRSHHKRSPSPARRSKAPLPSQQDAFSSNGGGMTSNRNGRDNKAMIPAGEKQKPNYGTSGKLAAETNTVSIGGEAIILKYHEPSEARKPPSSQAWRMYEFKGDSDEPLSTTELGIRSCWLFGREKAVVDFLIEHPSCSKQHAVVQFRYHEKRSEFGDKIGAVKPYVLDLESANGVKVNGSRIPDRRYIELKSGDAVGFGESTREYIVLLPPKEKSKEQ